MEALPCNSSGCIWSHDDALHPKCRVRLRSVRWLCVYVASVTIIHVLQYLGNRGITDIMIDNLIKITKHTNTEVTMYEMKYYRNSLIDFNQSSHGYPQSFDPWPLSWRLLDTEAAILSLGYLFFISLSYKIKLLIQPCKLRSTLLILQEIFISVFELSSTIFSKLIQRSSKFQIFIIFFLSHSWFALSPNRIIEIYTASSLNVCVYYFTVNIGLWNPIHLFDKFLFVLTLRTLLTDPKPKTVFVGTTSN